MAGRGLPYREYLRAHLRDPNRAADYLREAIRMKDEDGGSSAKYIALALESIGEAWGLRVRVSPAPLPPGEEEG